MVCSNCGENNSPDRESSAASAGRRRLASAQRAPTNPVTVKFCGECGAPMGTIGVAAAPSERVLLGSHQSTAVLAEIRLVSVLFADLVGFTALSEREPEAVRELLRGTSRSPAR